MIAAVSAILSSLVTGKEVNFEDVYTEGGLSKIDSTDFRYASRLRASMRLSVRHRLPEIRSLVNVFPLLVSDKDPLYAMRCLQRHCD